MAEVIDAFTHVLPPEFYEEIRKVHHKPRELDTLEDADHMWDLEKRIEDMDANGVDKQVINLYRPPIWLGMDPDDALPLTRLANDLVRDIADEYPDRFIPVCTVPFLTGEYVDEFERCVEDLGMAGVQIFSNIEGRPLDDPDFHEFYAAVEDADVPIWIHPQLYDWMPWIDERSDHKMLGWPFDTSVAMNRLVFSGTLDEYPGLRLIPHHMGGMIPFFGKRILTFYKTRRERPDIYPVDWPEFSRPIEEYFGQFYADTAVSASPEALRCGYEFFGPDNVVFAVDYPLGPDAGREWLEDTIPAIEGMEIPEGDKEKIFGGNIQRLLD
ncbi:MAG: amidohydrolase family protein [Halobacteriales archaeon]|nr:amidohydrolase family protein [Halobacteriales archaeon]